MMLKEMYLRAIEHYKKDKQIKKTIEELNELIDALLAYRCAEASEMYVGEAIESVEEEMADVLNMIEQLKIIFEITDEELLKTMKQKMDRTMERIDEEVAENG